MVEKQTNELSWIFPENFHVSIKYPYDQFEMTVDTMAEAHLDNSMEGCTEEKHLTALIEASVNKKGGATKDSLLEVQAFSDMETKLGGAPLALGILGGLAVISASGPDFSLSPDPNEQRKYECIKYPKSFRASLTQVGNEVYSALLTAHSNMDFIEVTMSQVPGMMQDIVAVLRRGTPGEIKDQLPIDLRAMEAAAKNGKLKVKEVLDSFESAIKTQKELVEATQAARALSEQSKDKVDIELKLTEREDEEFQKELKQTEEELSQVSQKLEEEEREFKAELDKCGSWNDALKQNDYSHRRCCFECGCAWLGGQWRHGSFSKLNVWNGVCCCGWFSGLPNQ